MKYLSKLVGIGMLTASLYGCGGNGGSSVNPVININGYSKLNKTCTGVVNVSVDAENGKSANIRHGKNSQNKDSTELKKNGNRYEGEVEFKEPGKYFIDYEVSDGNNKKNSEESTLEIIASKKDFYNYAVTSLKDKNISFTEDKETINGKKLRYMMKANNNKGAPLYIYYKTDDNCNDANDSDDINIINNVKLDSIVINNYYNNIPSSLEELMNQLLAALNNANRPPTVKYLTANPNPVSTNNTTTLMAGVSDPDGDSVTVTWNSLVKGQLAPAYAVDTTLTKQLVYNSPGTDTVNIIVSDGSKTASSSMSVAINDPVIINNAPVALIDLVYPNAPSTYIRPGQTLIVKGDRSSDPDGDNISYSWTKAGDANILNPNSANSNVTFNSLGNVVFSLNVSDGNLNSSATKSVDISNRAPNARTSMTLPINFNHIQYIHPGQQITIKSDTSDDDDGDILTRLWEQMIGIPIMASNSNVNNTFNVGASSPYSFRVSVNDGYATSTSTLNADVKDNQIPFNSLTHIVYNDVYHPGETHPGRIGKLNYSNGDYDGTVTAYVLNQISGPASGLVDNNDGTANLSFSGIGNHIYKIESFDDDGTSKNVTRPISIITNSLPTGGLGIGWPSNPYHIPANSNKIHTGQNVNFNANVNDVDGNVVDRNIEFGNGVTSTNLSTSYNYPATGNFIIKLNMTDDDGDYNSVTQTVNVVGNIAPVADFGTGQSGLVVDLNCNISSDADGSIIRYAIDWGDGFSCIESTTGNTCDSTFNGLMSHTYIGAGVYDITLMVKDDDNTSSTAKIRTITLP